MCRQVKSRPLLEQSNGKSKKPLLNYITAEGENKMVKIEMEATSIADLKKQMKEFLNDEKQKEDTVTKAKKKDTPVKSEVPEKVVEEETKTKTVKEEPKPEAEKVTTPEELTDDQKTELRSLCADYIHKVSDGKENIKKFLNTKGVAKVTELKPADLPEFKAMVQI